MNHRFLFISHQKYNSTPSELSELAHRHALQICTELTDIPDNQKLLYGLIFSYIQHVFWHSHPRIQSTEKTAQIVQSLGSFLVKSGIEIEIIIQYEKSEI